MFPHDRLACAFRLGEELPTRPVPAGDAYIRHPWARWLLAAAMVAICHAAQAHGIVGNRVFPGTLAFDIESGWMHRNWGPAQRSGFDTTTLGLKGLLYQNDLHEVMISAGLAWGIGGSGAQGVGANYPDT